MTQEYKCCDRQAMVVLDSNLPELTGFVYEVIISDRGKHIEFKRSNV